jgi:hypothetical protein
MFHHFPPGKYWDSSLKYATNTSYQLIIHSYPIIQCCVTYAAEESSLNKPRLTCTWSSNYYSCVFHQLETWILVVILKDHQCTLHDSSYPNNLHHDHKSEHFLFNRTASYKVIVNWLQAEWPENLCLKLLFFTLSSQFSKPLSFRNWFCFHLQVRRATLKAWSNSTKGSNRADSFSWKQKQKKFLKRSCFKNFDGGRSPK